MISMRVIEVEHKDVYTNFLDSLYEILMDEGGVEVAAAGYLEHFITADGMQKLFKDGFTMMLLPNKQFVQVEILNKRNVSFAVRIAKDGKTFAWIMSDDCSY